MKICIIIIAFLVVTIHCAICSNIFTQIINKLISQLTVYIYIILYISKLWLIYIQ